MQQDLKVALATGRMADALERYGCSPLVVKATRVAAGRQVKQAILAGTPLEGLVK